MIKMTKYYEKTATRMGETLNSVLAWDRGEERLGMKNSLFICEEGKVKQYVTIEEGEAFHNRIREMTEQEFDEICDEFIKAIKEKDLETMHVGLAVFDEMDNYPLLGNNVMRARLKRIREHTHMESHLIKNDESLKDFILYKGEVYLKNGTKKD